MTALPVAVCKAEEVADVVVDVDVDVADSVVEGTGPAVQTFQRNQSWSIKIVSL